MNRTYIRQEQAENAAHLYVIVMPMNVLFRVFHVYDLLFGRKVNTNQPKCKRITLFRTV